MIEPGWQKVCCEDCGVMLCQYYWGYEYNYHYMNFLCDDCYLLRAAEGDIHE